jgi:hypothetical protein
MCVQRRRLDWRDSHLGDWPLGQEQSLGRGGAKVTTKPPMGGGGEERRPPEGTQSSDSLLPNVSV